MRTLEQGDFFHGGLGRVRGWPELEYRVRGCRNAPWDYISVSLGLAARRATSCTSSTVDGRDGPVAEVVGDGQPPALVDGREGTPPALVIDGRGGPAAEVVVDRQDGQPAVKDPVTLALQTKNKHKKYFKRLFSEIFHVPELKDCF